MKYIDLHTHSTASDGGDTPEEVVRKAKALNLAAVALTDHDTMDGHEAALTAGRDIGMKVIPGCELSSTFGNLRFHIVGLWVPRDNGPFNKMLADLREKRQDRNTRIIEKLRALGFDISLEEVVAESARSKTDGKVGSVGRPHIASVLTRKGYVRDNREAFDKYLKQGKKAWLPKEVLPTDEACHRLAEIGATVVLAHPFLEQKDGRPRPAEIDEAVARLVPHGLNAIEVLHPAHTPEDEKAALEIAARHWLLPSGGSDYHAAKKPDISLGTGKGTLAIPEDVLLKMEELRRSMGLPC